MGRDDLRFVVVVSIMMAALLAFSAFVPAVEVALGQEKNQTGPAPEKNISVTISRAQLWLVVALLAVLVLLFYFLFSYSHRLDSTSYTGQLYLDGVYKAEYDRLSTPHKSKWETKDAGNNNGYDNDVV